MAKSLAITATVEYIHRVISDIRGAIVDDDVEDKVILAVLGHEVTCIPDASDKVDPV